MKLNPPKFLLHRNIYCNESATIENAKKYYPIYLIQYDVKIGKKILSYNILCHASCRGPATEVPTFDGSALLCAFRDTTLIAVRGKRVQSLSLAILKTFIRSAWVGAGYSVLGPQSYCVHRKFSIVGL